MLLTPVTESGNIESKLGNRTKSDNYSLEAIVYDIYLIKSWMMSDEGHTMKLIVWGTGNLYQKYRVFLSQFKILRFCDNNPDQTGRILDGVEVIFPLELMKYDFDYLVIMSYATEGICQQIEELGISADKVILYSQLWYLKKDSSICIHSVDGEIGFDDWIENNQNSILLISHIFNYTGIPVALKNMANVLRRMGYSVLMAAMSRGTFVRELQLDKFDYIDDLEMGFQTRYFEDMLQQFRAVVVGSFALYKLSGMIERVKTPTIWWIHETHEMYYAGKEKLIQRDGLRFFAGGNRVKRVFNSHYTETEIQTLQYCIPDFRAGMVQKKENEKLTIAVIGSVDERKAQDILLEAVIGMSEAYRNRLQIIFIGILDKSNVPYVNRITELSGLLNNLEWIPEMTQEKLEEFYPCIDILVCPSRDDPMPIVVAQAMMHERVCVISENVGQAEFIVQWKNGFVFPNEDISTLKGILIWLLDNREQCVMLGKASRKIYEEEFSEEIMEKRLKKVLEELHITKDNI